VVSAPLDQARAFIRRYVVVSPEAADFLALWVLHTWAFEAAVTTPYVRVVSAERESGKTQLLEVLALLVRRPWLEINTTAAVVFRGIDAEAPTLLLDEIDQAPFADRRDLLAVLNAGYKIGAKVRRNVGDRDMVLRAFDVFCPKAFAGIDDGKLPDTLRSRSIHVRLERRRADEWIERFRHRVVEPVAEKLRDELEQSGIAAVPTLVDTEPDLPDELSDREQEVWEPLLAIADLAGGGWPERARHAALTLARAKGRTDESRGVRLLHDLRQVFADKGDPERFFSLDLVEALNAIEESGWGGWNDGTGMRTRDLTHQLDRYPISSQKVRIGEHTRQGFYRRQFLDAWARYLPKSDPPPRRNRTNPGLEPDVLFPPQDPFDFDRSEDQ
jgi:Protein of unknown function (DUF3631)